MSQLKSFEYICYNGAGNDLNPVKLILDFFPSITHTHTHTPHNNKNKNKNNNNNNNTTTMTQQHKELFFLTYKIL